MQLPRIYRLLIDIFLSICTAVVHIVGLLQHMFAP
jgi:hypothetical protein